MLTPIKDVKNLKPLPTAHSSGNKVDTAIKEDKKMKVLVKLNSVFRRERYVRIY